MANSKPNTKPTGSKPSGAKPGDASGPPSKPVAKKELYQKIMDLSGLGRKEVNQAMDALGEVLAYELGKKGPGQVILPGILRIKVVKKPATKQRQGTNPFTKEPMVIKARPARKALKITPAKALKDRLI